MSLQNNDHAAVSQCRTARGYLGHRRPTRERADLAAQTYVQRRPIERPTLHQIAFAYRVSVGAIQQRLNGNGKHVTVEEALASWRAWTPGQRAAFGRGAGVGENLGLRDRAGDQRGTRSARCGGVTN
jgi:hypothetical protein